MSTFQIVVPSGNLGVRIASVNNVCTIVGFGGGPQVLAHALQVGDTLQAVNHHILQPNGNLKEWIELMRSCDLGPQHWRSLTVFRPIHQQQQSGTNVTPPPNNTNPKALQKITNTTKSKKKTTTAPTKKKTAPSKKKVASTTKTSNVPAKTKTTSTKKAPPKDPNLVYLPKVDIDEFPLPGYVCPKKAYYSTLNSETTTTVAEKLGCPSWKDIAFIADNVERYGTLKGSTLYQKGTLLRIPTTASKWKLQKLLNQEEIQQQELAVCTQCHEPEKPHVADDDPPPIMLLCDGCDTACHLHCTQLKEIPEQEWFCDTCLDVLAARKAAACKSLLVDVAVKPPSQQPSLTTPPPPSLPAEMMELRNKMCHKLVSMLQAKKERTIQAIRESLVIQEQEIRNRIVDLRQQVVANKAGVASAKRQYSEVVKNEKRAHGLVSWEEDWIGDGYRWIEIIIDDSQQQQQQGRPTRSMKLRDGCVGFEDAKQLVARFRRSTRLRGAKASLEIARTQLSNSLLALGAAIKEETELPKINQEEFERAEREYAGLLGMPQLPHETKQMFCNREFAPKLLGFVKVVDQEGLSSLYSLKEPDSLILTVPIGDDVIVVDDDDGDASDDISMGGEYAIFARSALFDTKRDDELPMVPSGTRDAQKRLMMMLLADPRNIACSAVVSRPSIPNSVKLRGEDDESGDASKCFDLSELVRDCNCDLDMPRVPTPARLAEKGLKLRDYQQASLQWMLDKENEREGLGLAGELWSQMQTIDGEMYYFCDLTGTFSFEIFDFSSEAGQKDVAKPCGSLPAGGILGEEMGLGKTIVCLSLIVANPPPKHTLMLPREHKWTEPVQHPAFTPPPSVVGAITGKKKIVLSNGTLVVAPMTLCSQWQSEIEKFAPWMKVLTIHNSESFSVEQLASADVVVASTFLFQAQGKAGSAARLLLNKVKAIHFHRIIVDESHYNQQGQKTQQALATVSATYRWCSTGTPIGHSLDDLHGQLRFLRVPQFTRQSFWKNAIGDPYHEHNTESLRVLRSLLSRLVVRHSKEQTLASGQAMLELPPRSVTTEILPFGSDHERKVYETLEARNRMRFEELRRESPAKVLSKSMELMSMLYSTRQSCAHASLIDLFKLERLNQSLEREKEKGSSKNRAPEKKPKAKSNTRAGILEEAVGKARESAKNRVKYITSRLQEGLLLECPICLEAFDEQNASISPCGHLLCDECVLSILDGGTSSREASGRCPTCRASFSRSEITFLGDAEDAGKPETPGPTQEVKDSEVSMQISGFAITDKQLHVSAVDSTTRRAGYQPVSECDRRELRNCLSTLPTDFLHSFEIASGSVGTKVARLIEEVQAMIRKDPTNKAVCFSQFLGVLDVACEELAKLGVVTRRIDGNMKQHERADALLDFSTDPQVKVLILSMRSGAVGLTLTSANHCFIMDVAQNSAVEEQAIDRIHRIGQTRAVTVKRFVMEGTVEERILASRRSIAADRPQVSTQIDGAALMREEQNDMECCRPAKRARREDEEDMAERSLDRLHHLEALFGLSKTTREERVAEKA